MDELNFVERIGLEVLRRRIDRKETHIHKWTPAELAEIERSERRTKLDRLRMREKSAAEAGVRASLPAKSGADGMARQRSVEYPRCLK
jgi:hypothetical protein